MVKVVLEDNGLRVERFWGRLQAIRRAIHKWQGSVFRALDEAQGVRVRFAVSFVGPRP